MTETQSTAWSQYQEAEIKEKAVGFVRILGLVQLIVGLVGIGAGLFLIASGLLPYINVEIGLANALSIIVLQGLPVLLFGGLLFNVGRAILSLDTWAFSWVMYGNVIVAVLYFLIGGWLPFLLIGNAIAFVLLFTPGARAYWWQLFREDLGPRMKELRYSLYLIRRSPLVVGGVIIIVGYVVIALTVHLWAPYGPTERIWTETLRPPSPNHIWGTDQNGGDIFSMVMWASRIDLRIALSVVAVALIIGTLVGAAAGYFGGAVDEIVMRITDVFFAFPGLILAMAIVAESANVRSEPSGTPSAILEMIMLKFFFNSSAR